MNTFGTRLRLTTFGESHGKAMGGVIDGFPPGFKIDFAKLHNELDKRRPGNSSLASQRNEEDIPEFLSGISPDGITLGTPIGFIIPNKDQRSEDYKSFDNIYRPNHADYTYQIKYGIRDPRGGGRASARETVNWVTAGALALQWLSEKGIEIHSFLSSVGDKEIPDLCRILCYLKDSDDFRKEIFSTYSEIYPLMEKEISDARKRGDSVGGKVSCIIFSLPPGIGDPVSDKLQASLAKMMMSINGAKGFEYGAGFDAVSAFGSQSADSFTLSENGDISTTTNFSGGIQGGISNGMPIHFSVAFKPTPTINLPLSTINAEGDNCILEAKGRHDPCIALRAVEVVKAMTAFTVMDLML